MRGPGKSSRRARTASSHPSASSLRRSRSTSRRARSSVGSTPRSLATRRTTARSRSASGSGVAPSRSSHSRSVSAAKSKIAHDASARPHEEHHAGWLSGPTQPARLARDGSPFGGDLPQGVSASRNEPSELGDLMSAPASHLPGRSGGLRRESETMRNVPSEHGPPEMGLWAWGTTCSTHAAARRC